MKQRGGKLITKIVENVRKNTLQPIIKEHVKEDSTIHTDELLSYKGLEQAMSIRPLIMVLVSMLVSVAAM